MGLELLLPQIKDQVIRENFSRIQSFMSSIKLLKGDWQFFEIDIPAAATQAIRHGLPFVPRDIILLHITGDHRVYFKYQDFDATNIYVVASGPCVLRFFAGATSEKAYNKRTTIYPFVAP
jgi:hypothetical protein